MKRLPVFQRQLYGFFAGDFLLEYIFQGLRQCYIFLENVDKVPDLTESVKQTISHRLSF